MSNVRTDDLKTGSFDTWATIEAKRAEAVKTVTVKVDHKAATRQAIIVAIRKAGVPFMTRSEWKAKPSARSDGPDWDYSAIVIHHAGNSYSCSADGAELIRKAEDTDIATFGHISYHYAIDCMGTIYEALDIREKGAHLKAANTGKIGIVFLSDFSLPGEAVAHGPSWGDSFKRGAKAGVAEILGQAKDAVSTSWDTPTTPQLNAVDVLVKTLVEYFKIAMLGGHREFASANDQGRACPGAHGLKIARDLRDRYGLDVPK